MRLQAAEDALRTAEAELARIPQERATLEANLAEGRARLDSVQRDLESCQAQRRKHEGELQDLEGKRSKYKGQLMEVKTNKEYTAMLHEIETVERQISETEDRILEEMERSEKLGEGLERERSAFKQVEDDCRAQTASLGERERRAQEHCDGLRTQRDAVAATLSDAHRELFARVSRLRGAAVARAADSMCQLCHVVLRPQMFVDVKRNEEIIQCPSCSRVLYYETPSNDAAVHP